MSISAAASRLVISPVGLAPRRPALPSKTQGPASFLGVMGPSVPFIPGGDGVRLVRSGARPAPDAALLMGRGWEIACGIMFFCGVPGVMLTVKSILSTSWRSRGWSACPAAGAASDSELSCSSALLLSSCRSCCHSSESSSTSASRSAPARQLGQIKIGYCGEISSDLTHLKCQVCEQGATNRDWQGAIDPRHIEQS